MHLYYNKQYNKLRGQTNPNVHELASFLETEQALGQPHKLRALRLKYEAMTTVPTTIEKTMTPYQLYQSGNPMWAKELSADSIESFLVLEYDMDPDRSAGKLSKLIFEQTYEHEKEQNYTKTVDWSSYYPKTMLQL
jgi:hypothetical protein